jgi:hypothetical protein
VGWQESKMGKDAVNYKRVKDEGDNGHGMITARAQERVHFVDFTNQLGSNVYDIV